MNRATTQLDATSPSIEVRDLRHVYKGGHVALDGVNLPCGTGVYGLLGPNGAGKTTTFYMIVGLLKPDAGSIILDKVDIFLLLFHPEVCSEMPL